MKQQKDSALQEDQGELSQVSPRSNSSQSPPHKPSTNKEPAHSPYSLPAMLALHHSSK